MSTIFPLSASVGQIFDGYQYDGSKWLLLGYKNSLPSQVGNAGKYLRTDGATLSWQPVDVSSDLVIDGGFATDTYEIVYDGGTP